MTNSIGNGTMTATRFLEFCQRLLRDEGRPVVLASIFYGSGAGRPPAAVPPVEV